MAPAAQRGPRAQRPMRPLPDRVPVVGRLHPLSGALHGRPPGPSRQRHQQFIGDGRVVCPGCVQPSDLSPYPRGGRRATTGVRHGKEEYVGPDVRATHLPVTGLLARVLGVAGRTPRPGGYAPARPSPLAASGTDAPPNRRAAHRRRAARCRPLRTPPTPARRLAGVAGGGASLPRGPFPPLFSLGPPANPKVAFAGRGPPPPPPAPPPPPP